MVDIRTIHPRPGLTLVAWLVAGAAGVLAAGCIGGYGGGGDFAHQAEARRVADVDDLIGGPAAQGRPGDIVMENEHVRVIVGQEDGAVIDADVRRLPKQQGYDNLAGLRPWHNLGRTMAPRSVAILEDGRATDRAVVEASGVDALLPGVDPYRVAARLNPADPAAALGGIGPGDTLPLDIRTRYILEPGARGLIIETTYANRSAEKVELMAGDLVDVRGDAEPFLSARHGHLTGRPSPGFGFPPAPGGGEELGYNGLAFAGFSGSRNAYIYEPIMEAKRRPTAGQSSCTRLGGALGCLVGGRWSADGGPRVQDGAFAGVSGGERLTVPPRGEGVAVIRRFLWIGSHLADAAGGAFARDGRPTAQVTVRVRDGAGDPVADADVAVLAAGEDDGSWTPWLHARTGTAGAAAFALPVGNWRLAAHKPGYGYPGGTAPDLLTVRINEDTEEAAADLRLAAPGRVEFFTRDHALDPRPMRVVVLGQDPNPELLYSSTAGLTTDATGNQRVHPFGDPARLGSPAVPAAATLPWTDTDGNPVPAAPIVAVVDTDADGFGTVELEPGSYTALASRGPAYDYQARPLEIAGSGGINRLLLEVPQVVDTLGWHPVDLGIKGWHDPNGRLGYGDLRRAAAAEGLELAVVADRNFLTPQPLLDRHVAEPPQLAMATGLELAATGLGSFGAFPLEADPLPLHVKPITAAGEQLNPESSDGGAPGWYNDDADQIRGAGGLLSLLAGLGEIQPPFVQAYAPRAADGSGWFERIGLSFDLSEGYAPAAPRNGAVRTSLPTNAPGEISEPGTFADGFRGLELFNGLTDAATGWRTLDDAFAFWNLGKRVVAVAGSGSDRRLSPAPGSLRTAVLHTAAADVNQLLDLRSTTFDRQVATDLEAGRAVVTNAPLLHLTLRGWLVDFGGGTTTALDVYETVQMGEILHVDREALPTDGSTDFELRVTATVRIQTPLWAPVNRIELFANAPIAQPATTALDGAGSFLTAATVAAWDLGAGRLAAAAVDATLRRPDNLGNAVTTVASTGRRYDLTVTHEVVVPASRLTEDDPADLWIAARATGNRNLYPLVLPGAGPDFPIAVANPVFVDLGGDLQAEFDTAYQGPCEQPNSQVCPR